MTYIDETCEALRMSGKKGLRYADLMLLFLPL